MNRTRSSRRNGNSDACGSLTLHTSPARDHTSAAVSRIVAPALRYSSSVIDAPAPAPACTSTGTWWCTNSRTPSGVMATRCSLFLISVGTPTVSGCAHPCTVSFCASVSTARRMVSISANSSGPHVSTGASCTTGSTRSSARQMSPPRTGGGEDAATSASRSSGVKRTEWSSGPSPTRWRGSSRRL